MIRSFRLVVSIVAASLLATLVIYGWIRLVALGVRELLAAY